MLTGAADICEPNAVKEEFLGEIEERDFESPVDLLFVGHRGLV